MTKHPEIYYHYDDLSKIIYWSEDMIEDRPDLIFLGQSANPNKRMAIAVFTHKLPEPSGWRLEEFD